MISVFVSLWLAHARPPARRSISLVHTDKFMFQAAQNVFRSFPRSQFLMIFLSAIEHPKKYIFHFHLWILRFYYIHQAQWVNALLLVLGESWVNKLYIYGALRQLMRSKKHSEWQIISL